VNDQAHYLVCLDLMQALAAYIGTSQFNDLSQSSVSATHWCTWTL
jgi:hypothetical protein